MADTGSPAAPDREEPGWLSADEQAAWLALGSLVMRLPAAVDGDLQATCGLSLFEYLVLSTLSEAPGRAMRMSELGPRVHASPSRLSHAVARLERRGWVGREPLPEDARQIVATLSPDGYRKVEASAPKHVRFVRELVVDVLSPTQLCQLRAVAEAIVVSLDAAQRGRTATPVPPCGREEH